MNSRLSSIALILCLLLSLLPIGTAAADIADSGTCGENVTWLLNRDGLLTIRGVGNMETYDGGQLVSPFAANTAIRSVVIEPGITGVGSYAFESCTGITSVMLPDGIAYIGDNAFLSCSALKSVKLPDTVSDIGEYAFSCSGLSVISIPDGVSMIPAFAFEGCKSMTDLMLPASLSGIDFCAFSGCSALSEVYCGSSKSAFDRAVDPSNAELLSAEHIHYNVTDAQGHIQTVVTAPTCTEDGFTARSCACGYEYEKTDITPATGHQWGEWTVCVPASPDGEGVSTRTCAVCCATETKSIPKSEPTSDDPTPVEPAPTLPTPVKPTPITPAPSASVPPEPTPRSTTPTNSPQGTTPSDPKPTDPVPDAQKPQNADPADPAPAESKPKVPKTVSNPFSDVRPDDYFFDPVLWAWGHVPQITDGTGKTTFSPADACTRGQVVTFLWRSFGCEEPKIIFCPFEDIQQSDYFYKAVLWAVEKGITDGTGDTMFSPQESCTRAHVVTFLWRAENAPNAGSDNPFEDVEPGQYYSEAVLWALSSGITDGTSNTTFSPNEACTRGQIVTFLYRDLRQEI